MKKELPAVFDASLYTGPKSEVVKTWMDLFTQDQLTPAYLREWFSPRISEYFSVDALGSIFRRLTVSDSLSTLADFLEEFIYNGEKDRVTEFLQRTGEVTSQCGKGFKHGEPSYNCRECCVDHTCVMCAECFQNSQHRHHKYRMATSTGGGYCDCGDIEAWKSYPCCETHQPSPGVGSLPPIPPDMDKRAKLVFAFVLDFSDEVINKFYCANLIDAHSHNDEPQQQYLILMYNDEIHTFDQVINLLVQVTGCTQKRGLELASEINRDGRAIILTSDFDTCSLIKSQIERISSASGQRMLEAHVVPFQVVAHQCFVSNILLEWTQTLLKTNQGFRSAIIEVFTFCNQNAESFLDKILVNDTIRWKSARAQWNALLCSVFLPDNSSKKILAAHYLKKYHRIMENYLNDDEDHSFSVAGLSVQLFTVPSVAHELISRYGALALIMNFIINVSTNDRNANGKVVFKRMFSRSFERACYLLYDIRYLLCSPPNSAWPDQLRRNFIAGMSSFFDFLGFIEGMDAYKRQLGSHIEFEREWETAFNLQLKCFPVITDSLKWCASDDRALVEVFETAIFKLKEGQDEQQREEISLNILGSTFTCTKFNTTENAVSMHLPLTRYWGALYSILISSEQLLKAIQELPIVELIEPVMRTRAVIAQFRAGMWRKNGHSTSSQVFFYHDTKFRAKTLDMDIIVLQIGASLIDSNAFLANLAYKFGLLSFIQSDKEITPELPETDEKKLWALVDEFLHMIIILTAERFQVGIGRVTTSDCIKHELIHLLALEPMSHSQLTKAYGRQSEHESLLEGVIKDLTEFKLSSETTGKGQYHLKDSYHPDFNLFFYHFTKEISFKTEQAKKELYKKENGLECCPPPDLPPFTGPLSKIINLLNCDITLHVMKLVLDVWLQGIEQGVDNQLHKSMFLFGLALKEEEKSGGRFVFTAKATELNIVKLMVDVYCSGRLRDHRDLVKWVLQKYGSLVGDRAFEAAMCDFDEKQNNEKRQSGTKSRAEAARAVIMANMKMMQEQFSKKYQELDQESGKESSSKTDKADSLRHGKQHATDTESSFWLGCSSHDSMTCILCQGDESLGMEGKAMVYAAFVQLSTVHMRNRDPFTPEDLRERFLTSKMGPSPFIKTCGHVMHAKCWEDWQLDLSRSRATGPPQNRPSSHDPVKHEFLCPLCECISNILMPIIPSDVLASIYPSKKSEQDEDLMSLTFLKWLDITLKILRVLEIQQRESTSESSHCDYLENTSQRASTTVPLQQDVALVTLPQNQQSTLNLTVSNVGYNLNFEDKWILHIKRIADASSVGSELGLMEIPTEKLNWVHALASAIFRVAVNSRSPLEDVHWDFMMVWKTLAYTIHSFEAALHADNVQGRPPVNPRDETCLENLIAIAYGLSLNKKPPSSRLGANHRALELLGMVVKNDKDSKCVLEWDCFGVLVPLLVVSPNLVGDLEHVPSFESFSVRLMLISRMAQILLTLDFEKFRTDSLKLSSDTKCLPILMSLLRHKCLIFDADGVWGELKKGVTPFLRCCMIFFYYKNPSKYRNYDRQFKLMENDFDALARHLELPVSCKELLDECLTISLFVTWGEHPKVRDFHIDSPTSWKFEPYVKEIGTRRISRLVKLPQDYSELLNRVRDFSCINAEINDSQNPTMCLICGKILCSLSYCCQGELNIFAHKQKVGSCTFHAYECGGGVGVFLRIRDCQLFILAGLRVCYKTPPYLDEHHEPDQGLRRGNKLLLSEKIYEQLEMAWRNHSLYEMVTRTIEMTGGFGWNNWMIL